jgi:ribulose kinase
MTGTWKAAILTGAAIFAGIVGPGLAAAKADPISPVVAAYATRYAGAVCAVLDAYPSVGGVTGALQGVMADGFTAYEAGQVVGIAVVGQCPEHLDAVQAFIDRYSAARQLA